MKTKFLVGAVIIGLAVLLSIYVSGKTGSSTLSTHTELLLRKIGHDVLLSTGDDSSRVMPVSRVTATKYRVLFENPLALSHDSLIRIVNSTLINNRLSRDYNVAVIECTAGDVVYGFAMANTLSDSLVPCTGRKLPTGCYYLDIEFIGNKIANTSGAYFLLGGLGLLALGYLGIKREKKQTEADLPAEIPQERIQNNFQIGQYIFNADQDYLEIAGVKTMLTNKESTLLRLFCGSINETISRDTLQKEVWENEGVIVTRSLDVFVSKLRKKLQADENVKIVNFPGKGYMLEVATS